MCTYTWKTHIYIYVYIYIYIYIYLSIYIYMTCQICRACTRWSSSNLLIRAAALRSSFFSCQSQMARLSEGDLAPPYSMYSIKITQHSFESMQFSSISPGWLYGVNRLGKCCLSAHQWFSSLFWPLLGFQRSWCFFPTFHLRLSSYFPHPGLGSICQWCVWPVHWYLGSRMESIVFWRYTISSKSQ